MKLIYIKFKIKVKNKLRDLGLYKYPELPDWYLGIRIIDKDKEDI